MLTFSLLYLGPRRLVAPLIMSQSQYTLSTCKNIRNIPIKKPMPSILYCFNKKTWNLHWVLDGVQIFYEGVQDVDGEMPDSNVDPGGEHDEEVNGLEQLVHIHCHLEYSYEYVWEVHKKHDDSTNGKEVDGVREEHEGDGEYVMQ